MQSALPVLSWLHLGDLHITEAGEQNYIDLLSLVEAANRYLAGRIDFAVLPGDNADQGTQAQFKLVRDALERLRVPVHILPGDHDFHSRTLDAFHQVLGAERLPKSVAVKGCRCLFLDVVSPGGGGPDFRLDPGQLDWLQRELQTTAAAGERPVVFLHAYPADLREGTDRLIELLRQHRVACVDMGHTHYNELANDGRTIFMATRSTGQIEEGPVGFSVAAVDEGVVSWRFHPLAAEWPLVLITRPADHRMIVDPASSDQLIRGQLRIGANVWGERRITRVSAAIDDAPAASLSEDGQDAGLWRTELDRPFTDGPHRLTVEAEDEGGASGTETITFLVNREGRYEPPPRHADGSDRDAVGAWPEKHLLGTQLGPNRNGRKW